MDRNNLVYKAIRELILLGFFTKNNFENSQIYLGEYQYENNKYRLHLFSWGEQISIFIKCQNESIHLIIEDDDFSRRYAGPVTNDVYLHINKYRNVDFQDVILNSLYFFKNTNKEKVVFESKILLDYMRSDAMYKNPNGWGIGPCGFDGKRFIFNYPEYFDKKLENEECIKVFEGEFSPEIILNIIEQIYPRFKEIYIDNKIDGIIKALSQEELLTLKERLQSQDIKELVRRK